MSTLHSERVATQVVFFLKSPLYLEWNDIESPSKGGVFLVDCGSVGDYGVLRSSGVYNPHLLV